MKTKRRLNFMSMLCLPISMTLCLLCLPISVWSGPNTTIVIHSFGYVRPNDQISTFSIIVSTDGTNYFMKNGTTGQIDLQSTNASAVINNALGNGTGIVFLKAGTYVWNGTISLGENDTLCGEGSASIIDASASGTTYLIHAWGSDPVGHLRNVVVKNLQVIGPGPNAVGVGNAIDFWGVDDSLVENCWIKNSYSTGIRVATGSRNTVQNNDVYHCEIGILNSANYTTVTDNHVYSCADHGIDDGGANYFLVEGNTIQDGMGGISCDGGSHFTIADNTITNCSQVGIVITISFPSLTTPSTYFTVSGNQISNITLYGGTQGQGIILTSNSSFGDISHNTIYNCAASGIELQSNSSYNTISENTISFNAAFGILITHVDCLLNRISHNEVWKNTVEAIQDGGTGTIIQDNVGYVSSSDQIGTVTFIVNSARVQHARTKSRA